MNEFEENPDISAEHASAHDSSTEEIKEYSKGFKIMRGVVAFVVFVGIIFISGIYQNLFYRRTPVSIEQERVESRVDAETLTVPLTIFIIRAPEPYGSVRLEADVESLVENASRVWEQAGIELSIKNINTVSKSAAEMELFYDDISAFLDGIETFDPATINVFLTGTLDGINGVAFTGLRSVAVADYTSVYDFRALAHEVGHILGLEHATGSRGQLMYRGANGFELSLNEIEKARNNIRFFEE